MTLGVTHAALFTHPPAIHTEDLWEATDPFNPALSPPRPAKWRPLSPLSAPGHSPRSAAAVSRGTPGPPCRHRGGVAGTRAQPRVVAPLRGPPILPPSWGSPRTRALLPVPGARRKASRAPASRRGAGGDRQEATAKGKEEWGGGGGGRVRFDGRAFNSFRCWLAPVAPAAASCWGLQRPSAPTTGVRAAGAPNSCHPAPAQARGIRDARAGAAKAFNTSDRASLGFQERETLTNFEGGVDLMPKDDSEQARRGCSFSLWSSESLPLGESQWREP